MELDLLNLYTSPLEFEHSRPITWSETLEYNNRAESPPNVIVQKRFSINNELEAALHVCNYICDSSLNQALNTRLLESRTYRDWQNSMPEIPRELLLYKSHYTSSNIVRVSQDINKIGVRLKEGQKLFHGGAWSDAKRSITTERPFSTSLSPVEALKNGKHLGKAYKTNKLDLCVITLGKNTPNVFVYPNGCDLDNEREIVFASKCTLTIKSATYVQGTKVDDFIEGEHHLKSRRVPVRVVELELT